MEKELLSLKNIYDKILEIDTNFKNYYEPVEYGDEETQKKKQRKIIRESVQLAYFVLRDYSPLTVEERKVLFPKIVSFIDNDEVPFEEKNKYNINEKFWNKNEANLISFFLRFRHTSEKTALYLSLIKLFKKKPKPDIRKNNLYKKNEKK
ncbi:hypothetical protein [Vagococcus fluvialis]|uniref:hypothetical protein n=1 Tax=Vagococcus fluvialis TaxID=2738 RepID=UPI002B301E3A|nr:hypothetical protein QDW48_11740 [Vagococcus fluvialis]